MGKKKIVDVYWIDFFRKKGNVFSYKLLKDNKTTVKQCRVGKKMNYLNSGLSFHKSMFASPMI